jgi:Lon protease-like protein
MMRRRAALPKLRQRLEELVTKGSDTKVEPGTSDEQLINMVAQYLPMGLAERQGLLELRNVLLRVRALIELIESKTKPRAVATASLSY